MFVFSDLCRISASAVAFAQSASCSVLSSKITSQTASSGSFKQKKWKWYGWAETFNINGEKHSGLILFVCVCAFSGERRCNVRPSDSVERSAEGERTAAQRRKNAYTRTPTPMKINSFIMQHMISSVCFIVTSCGNCCCKIIAIRRIYLCKQINTFINMKSLCLILYSNS